MQNNTLIQTRGLSRHYQVGQQAVALRLSGDKTMLYRCRILGTQDTLFDNIGRHYLFNCDIQGSIDFIFGNARSLYQVLQDCPRFDFVWQKPTLTKLFFLVFFRY
jgi:pectin methylesterase-like acyl-CoA thioesterase